MSTAIAHAALGVTAAFFDGLWQGALIAGAVWLALRCLPKVGASTRYAIWLCALAAMTITPIVTATLSELRAEPVTTTAVTAQEIGAPAVAVAAPPIARAPSSHDAAPAGAVDRTSVLTAPRASQITIPVGVAFAVALVWVLVALSRALLLLRDLRALAAIRRGARPWRDAHDYPVLLSKRVRVPFAAGFLRPAVVLPASLVERLAARDIEAIVVHEVAHLRRYDVWTNALARIAEAFLALNPAAWFVMRRLTTEREIACDDWVVARTGAGDAFAHTLAAMATAGRNPAPLAAPSAFGSRHALVVRIERLLDARPRRLRLSPHALGGALMLLALIALTMQSVSPVLAYAPQPATVAQAQPARGRTACATPDHGIRFPARPAVLGRRRTVPASARELPHASAVAARAGAANTATFDLTVDATGRARKIALVSAPRYPGVANDIARIFTINRFEPATRDCAPVTSTIRTAVAFGAPRASVGSSVTPVYPNGWSAAHATACKVPALFHTGVPAFPDAMKDAPPGHAYAASVRVHVDGTGAAANAVLVTSSGHAAFDDALLAAARHATYPLTEDSGFKPVRPSGAPLSWNAAHGSATYRGCRPLPADYVWSTTFERALPLEFLAMAVTTAPGR